MALGFWGVGLPLLLFGFLFCRTVAEKVTVVGAGLLFLVVGTLISRARR
jgi:hypothetical protein